MSSKPIQVRTYGNPESPVKVALIHGGPGAQGDLAPLAQALADQTDWHILEPIQRYGSQEDPVTVARHIQDHAEALQGINPVIIGHSWGAMLALSLAADHPNLPQSLILVGSGTYSQTSRAEFERRRNIQTPPALAEEKSELKRQLSQATDPKEKEAIFRRLGEISDAVYYVDRIPAPPNNLPFDPLGHEQTWQDALQRQNDNLEPENFHKITCPVALIQGIQDPHPGLLIRNDLQPYIPQLVYHELDQCGHSPWLEKQARNPFFHLLTQLINP